MCLKKIIKANQWTHMPFFLDSIVNLFGYCVEFIWLFSFSLSWMFFIYHIIFDVGNLWHHLLKLKKQKNGIVICMHYADTKLQTTTFGHLCALSGLCHIKLASLLSTKWEISETSFTFSFRFLQNKEGNLDLFFFPNLVFLTDTSLCLHCTF